jgi:O-antigen ligase
VDSTFAKQIPVTKYLVDISISTRFQVEWPRAIAAWLSSPFVGTGPSSMGEATDGDYFRWLSETGAIGTFLFVGIIFEIMRTVWVRLKKISKKQTYLFYGFLFGILSLFVNASYIDVFEASKVAYTFWLVCGIFIAGITYFVSRKIKTDDLQMEV